MLVAALLGIAWIVAAAVLSPIIGRSIQRADCWAADGWTRLAEAPGYTGANAG